MLGICAKYHYYRGVARISVGGGGTGRAPRRENRDDEGSMVWRLRGCHMQWVGSGRRNSPLTRKKIVEFFLYFWVAISYRLAACFIRIGSTCGIEIYWRSFQHFRTILRPTPSENRVQK